MKSEADKKDNCQHMEPDRNINVPWELGGYSNADYIGDNDTCKSVTGYIFLINGAVISWRS